MVWEMINKKRARQIKSLYKCRDYELSFPKHVQKILKLHNELVLDGQSAGAVPNWEPLCKRNFSKDLSQVLPLVRKDQNLCYVRLWSAIHWLRKER
jgi:hypothetical protein